MYRLRIPVLIMVLFAVFSCSKEPIGYLEVRNHTNDTFTNVTWGESVHLGTIAPGEEKGEETEVFTGSFLFLEIGEKKYRSREEILVDANSSATFIVNDKQHLEYVP